MKSQWSRKSTTSSYCEKEISNARAQIECTTVATDATYIKKIKSEIKLSVDSEFQSMLQNHI